MARKRAAPDEPAPPPRRHLSEGPVAEAIARYAGNLAAVARSFGVSRASVWEYVSARPPLRAAVRDARETRVDNAESSLDRAVLDGEGWAVTLILKTLGKGRGYVERSEVEARESVRLVVTEEIVDADPGPGRPAAPGAG